MRRFTRTFLPILLGGIVGLTATARADDYPPRKPGLWEVSMTTGSGKSHAMGTKMCIDAASDAALYKMGMETAGSICSRRDVSRTGYTVTSDSVCMLDKSQMTSHTVTVFAGDVAYHTESKTHFDPPMMPGMSDSTMTQDAKWAGPCPADMKPGDIVMPNGMKMNMIDAQKGAK